MTYAPNSPYHINKLARIVTLWTKQGAARISKLIDTPEAWKLFTELEQFYFEHKVSAPDTPPVVEQTVIKTINAVDLADLVARMDALEEKVAGMEFAFKELAAALNRNADAQLSKIHRADKLIALADRLTDSPERNQLYLQAANLINGKRLF